MTRIDPFSLTTVPLRLCANKEEMGDATGFIWKDGEQHYLITNWHVVTGRNAQTGKLVTTARPNMIRTMFNTRIMDFGKQPWDIAIRDTDDHPLWLTHPLRQRGSDVVAIPLPIRGDDPIVNMYPINTLKSEADLAIRIGMDVFVLGYPFGTAPPGFPVWKRGSIASEPDLTRIGTGYMLVDTASRPGMSGALSFGEAGAPTSSKAAPYRATARPRVNSSASTPAAFTQRTRPMRRSVWSGRSTTSRKLSGAKSAIPIE
jgi:hypothetical protein